MTVYYWVFGVAIVVALSLWWLCRRWLWQNIFGVCFASSFGFSVAPLRIKIADLVDIQMQEGPHWFLLVVLAVLHFLTVNLHTLLGALPKWASPGTLPDRSPLLSLGRFVIWR